MVLGLRLNGVIGLLACPVVLGALSTGGTPSGPAGYDTSRLGPSNAICTRETYNLNITSTNYVFEDVVLNANETYLTKLLQEFVTAFPYQSNFTDAYEHGTQNVTGTYAISGTLCLPAESEKNPQDIQLLIHGIGYDSSYWDFAPNGENTYSYVYASAAAGITTFRYDRLGTGLSEYPYDAYNVVQKPTDVAIAIKFAEMLRTGDIGGRAYAKIVAVGHSYGSIQTQAMTVIAPTAVDGVVLTAYSANATALPLWFASTVYSTASLVFPTRFPNADLTNPYLVTLASWTSQLNYWYFPYYAQPVADYARAAEQPVTQGVLFTIANGITAAPAFAGDVLVDFVFCYGDCYAVPPDAGYASIPAGTGALFPAARTFEAYVPPNTGHIVNLHYSAPASFERMIQFAATVFAA